MYLVYNVEKIHQF